MMQGWQGASAWIAHRLDVGLIPFWAFHERVKLHVNWLCCTIGTGKSP